ncbi:hypothetical protein HW555_005779 [Spodoptera exigua]|uniref:Uncharacterized protein n=1 Tax=Spodoptera exigua TaxID=7107 RepID=A0A835GJ50_SPOEX|nr:hypothetical protein HW555_005779 [Spodoptera exigua]
MIQDSENSALTEQIAAFKSDPEKLREATEFVDQLIQQAKKEAELKQKEKDRSKFSYNINYLMRLLFFLEDSLTLPYHYPYIKLKNGNER